MSSWVGVVTLIVGLSLLITSWVERASIPRWLPRLSAAITALGFGAIAAAQHGIGWSILSIAWSIVAIVLLLLVIRDRSGGK